MMYKLFFTVILCSFTIVYAAPTSISTATLLKNGEEAQALNQQFKTFKATDTCQDGQSACVEGAIGKCQGTSWDLTRGKCSKSQSCFALPSISNEGTALTCTTEEAAAKSIEATGVNGGAFGEQSDNKDAMSSTPEATSSPVTSSSAATNQPGSTIVSDLPTSTASAPGTEESNSKSESKTNSQRLSIFSVPTVTSTAENSGIATATPAPAPAPSTDTNTTLEGTTITQITISPSRPSGTGPAPEIVTVTVTLSPSEPMTLAPQTRTLSPEEASSVISSILAAGGATGFPLPSTTTPTETSSTVSPSVDATELPESASLSAISSTTATSSVSEEGYGY